MDTCSSLNQAGYLERCEGAPQDVLCLVTEGLIRHDIECPHHPSNEYPGDDEQAYDAKERPE
jgi:hypothetical protein